jgi:hypothetical protein
VGRLKTLYWLQNRPMSSVTVRGIQIGLRVPRSLVVLLNAVSPVNAYAAPA